MVYYILLIPLLLIVYVLLKKKPLGQLKSKNEIQPKDISSPYRGPFNGIVTYEDKITGVRHQLTRIEDYKTPTQAIIIYPTHFYRVAVYTKPGHYPTEDIRDFTFGDLATMRKDALAYYYERINNNIECGRNPVLDYYNHFPFSKYLLQEGKTIAIVLYLVNNDGGEKFIEYLIGGDDNEFVADGRAYEAALVDSFELN